MWRRNSSPALERHSMRHKNLARAITFAVCAATVTFAHAADISGAGATFPFPIYAKWADAYKKDTGNGLNYQSIGSGGGIKQIEAKTVTFGATDKPLKPDELDKDGLVQFPDGHGRHRSGRPSRRHQAGRDSFSTARRSPTSISARSPSGTTRRSRSSIPSSTCPTWRSPPSIAPTARARPSTSPTISAR